MTTSDADRTTANEKAPKLTQPALHQGLSRVSVPCLSCITSDPRDSPASEQEPRGTSRTLRTQQISVFQVYSLGTRRISVFQVYSSTQVSVPLVLVCIRMSSQTKPLIEATSETSVDVGAPRLV